MTGTHDTCPYKIQVGVGLRICGDDVGVSGTAAYAAHPRSHSAVSRGRYAPRARLPWERPGTRVSSSPRWVGSDGKTQAGRR